MIAPAIAPRWFLIASSLLVLNGIAVLTSGIWRHVSADEPTVTTTAGADAPTPSANASGNPLDNIPVPDGLPEIPSLANPDLLQDDPGFEEFKRLFSKVEESWEGEVPPDAGAHISAHSAEYFAALDQRFLTAQRLCAAARDIAADAARLARQGRKAESAPLLEMAIQLRDMAAKLLVSEL